MRNMPLILWDSSSGKMLFGKWFSTFNRYRVTQSYSNNLIGDVVLDSFDMVYTRRDEDSIFRPNT